MIWKGWLGAPAPQKCVAKMPGVIRCGCPTCNPPVRPQTKPASTVPVCTKCQLDYPYANTSPYVPFVCAGCKLLADRL